MSKDLKDAHIHNMVGPILRAGELADAVIDALEEDNPDSEFTVDDRVAYIRIATENECILRRATMEEMLGRPFQMQELEVALGSFSGQIEADQEYMRFYFNKKL